jgi:hypothetical protein
MSLLAKRRIRSAAKRLGFYNAGNFLIGRKTKDIVSGFAIDAAPGAVYVWTFILPRFDEISFLHMSLGERVIDLSASDYSVEDGLKNAWKALADVAGAERLIDYLDGHDIRGEYATWVRFICLIRLGRTEEAERMLEVIGSICVDSAPRKFKELQDARKYGGWLAAQELLDDWSCRTEKLIEGVPSEG